MNRHQARWLIGWTAALVIGVLIWAVLLAWLL